MIDVDLAALIEDEAVYGRAPKAGEIQCLDATYLDETIFIAQVLGAKDGLHIMAIDPGSAQLELLGRLNAQ